MTGSGGSSWVEVNGEALRLEIQPDLTVGAPFRQNRSTPETRTPFRMRRNLRWRGSNIHVL